MIHFELDRITRKQVYILVLSILLLLLLQFLLIKYLKINLAETNSLEQNNKVVEASLKRKTDSVHYYKTNVQFNDIVLPQPAESPTKIYAILVNLLANLGFEETVVIKDSEAADSVSFKVTGKSDYFTLMRLFLSLRQSSYLLKLTSLNVSYSAPNAVNFTFIVLSKKDLTSIPQEIAK